MKYYLATLLLTLPLALPVSAAPLCSEVFTPLQIHHEPSQALRDPTILRAQQLGLVDDFKTLADLSTRSLTTAQKNSIQAQAKNIHATKGEAASVRFLIESLYEKKSELRPVKLAILKPQWTTADRRHAPTVEHIEKMWSELVRETPPSTSSSLIPLPHPLLIPGARFQEGYYWDSYFAFPALLRTGREPLVRGQINNFLFLLKNYGMIPNGTRDYYLTRSQPPLISQMVRLLLEGELQKGPLSTASQQWLAEAYTLIKKDYKQFWMNPKTRYDAKTGLNHYWDSSNTPRPERHSSDKETEIAQTFRDVRAEAESGKDFTGAFEGRASEYGAVSLNSILYQVEKDLSWMARLLNKPQDIAKFEKAAQRRRDTMNKLMWDSKDGVYRDVNLNTLKQSPILTADTFWPLHYQMATPEQVARVVAKLPLLERKGGLMSAEKETGKQWDAPYGWAPHHFIAISGLMKNGYVRDSERLAQKWVTSVDNIFQQTGKIIEKIDAVRGGVPHEAGDKYPTQDGFLWTNGVYMWALTDILRHPVIKELR